MKLVSKMFALIALALACSAASAQQTAPLTVTGNITPPACTASMSNDGAFEYGDIDARSLHDATTTSLPQPPNAIFKISCLSPAQVAWAIVDNRPDSSYFTDDTNYMGLGKDKGGHKIGTYFLRMTAPVLDGKPVYSVYSTDGGTTWASVGSLILLSKGDLYSYSKDRDSNTFDKGLVFSANVDIITSIAPKSTLDMSDEIDLDGSSTINLSYL